MFNIGKMTKNTSSDGSQNTLFSNNFIEVKKETLCVYNSKEEITFPIAIIDKSLVYKKRNYIYNALSLTISFIIIGIGSTMISEKPIMILLFAFASIFLAFGLLVNNKQYQFVIISSEGVKIIDIPESLKNEAIVSSRKLNKILTTRNN